MPPSPCWAAGASVCNVGNHWYLSWGPPVRAPSLGCAVEHAPHRPHEIDVPEVLAGVRLRPPDLACPEVADLAVALHENLGQRQLLAAGILCVVIALEGVGGRGQQ